MRTSPLFHARLGFAIKGLYNLNRDSSYKQESSRKTSSSCISCSYLSCSIV